MAIPEQNGQPEVQSAPSLSFRSLLWDWFLDKAKEAKVGISFDELHNAVDIEVFLGARTYYCHVGRIHEDSFNDVKMHDPRLFAHLERTFDWAVKTIWEDYDKDRCKGKLYSMIARG